MRRRDRSGSAPVAITLLAAWLTAAGCYSYRPARGAGLQPQPLAPDAWPAASTTEVAALADDTPGVIRELEPDPTTGHDLDEGRVQFLVDSATWRINAVRLDDHGLLRTWDAPAGDADLESLEFLINGFEPNGAYLTDIIASETRRRREDAAAAHDARSRGRATTALLPGVRATDDRATHWLLRDGIPVRTADVVGDERGIVIHLPAMFGNKYEQHVLERLADAGWAIVHVGSDATLRDPNGVERVRARQRLDVRTAVLFEERAGALSGAEFGAMSSDERMERVAHWTEARKQAKTEIVMPDSGFALHAGDDPESLGHLIARTVDEHLVEHARAAEAVVDLVDETHPALADRPIIVMGFSAGSLMAPTTAIRLRETHGERLAALVLVGGGGDLVSIALVSDVGDGGLELEPVGGPSPDAAAVERIAIAYRERTLLDPLAVAPALRDLPVLHVYASKDTSVPTSAAVAFNETHGRVDRLVYSGSHMGLFYFLPGQSGRIERWLRDATANRTDRSPAR